MALSQTKKFTIVGNKITSNIMGMYLKYLLNQSGFRNKIEIHHLKNDESVIFNSKRFTFEKIQKYSSTKEKKFHFDIKIHNKNLFDEMKVKTYENNFDIDQFISNKFPQSKDE